MRLESVIPSEAKNLRPFAGQLDHLGKTSLDAPRTAAIIPARSEELGRGVVLDWREPSGKESGTPFRRVVRIEEGTMKRKSLTVKVVLMFCMVSVRYPLKYRAAISLADWVAICATTT